MCTTSCVLWVEEYIDNLLHSITVGIRLFSSCLKVLLVTHKNK